MRVITVVYMDPFTSRMEVIKQEFNSAETKDSEALHYLLCANNPGENYTVSFDNLTKDN